MGPLCNGSASRIHGRSPGPREGWACDCTARLSGWGRGLPPIRLAKSKRLARTPRIPVEIDLNMKELR